MRILQITPHYFPEVQFGGPPRKIHALSRGFAARGHSVSVITFHSAEARLQVERDIEGIRVQYLPWFGRGTRQVPLSLSKLREAVHRSDVVHVYGLYNVICPISAWLAHRCGRPVVTEALGMYLPKARNRVAKSVYNHFVTHRMFHLSAAIIVASEEERAELAGAVDPARLVVRRNGIDLEEFKSLPDAAEFRQAYSIQRDERIILFLGRISPIKNIELLVRAFALSGVAGRLVLAGPMLEQPYAARISQVIAELRLCHRVLLPGPLYGQMKLSSLAAADLLVLPSLSESFGNAAAEAVAANVPVLLTDTCGIARLIHGRAGLAVAPEQDAIAQGLVQMMAPDRTRYTARRLAVLAELDWDRPLSETENLYERLLKRT